MNIFIAELNVFGLSSGPRQRNKIKANINSKIRERLMHQRNNNTNNDMTIQVLYMHIIQHSTIIGLQYLYIRFIKIK